MQPTVRTLVVAASGTVVAWVASVLLLLVQVTTPHPTTLALTATLGLAVPLMLTLTAVLAAQLYRRRSNELSTRASNFERRSAPVDVVERLEASVRDAGEGLREMKAVADRIEVLERSTMLSVGQLEARLREVEQRLRDVDVLTGRTARLEARADRWQDAPVSSKQPLEDRLREAERRVAKVEGAVKADSDAARQREHEHVAAVVAVGRHVGLSISEVVSQQQAVAQVRAAIARSRALDALPYLRAFPVLIQDLSLSELRVLFKFFRRAGFLAQAVALIEEIAQRFGKPEDARVAATLGSELELYSGKFDALETGSLPAMCGPSQASVVLHVVGKALPETQTGYTLRTQYTVEAQRRLGITPVVVAQSGAGAEARESTERYKHGGVEYYQLGGPQRGRVPWDEWLHANVSALAQVVQEVRPAVMHVHSDFVNALIALPVARAYGIPLVNETRGFWEESWLSRIATAEGWHDVDAIGAQHGYPDLYTLRAEREAVARGKSDAVITLARVMEEHIRRTSNRLGLPVPGISLAPNAVEVADFPVSVRDASLRDQLGIAPDSLVVGYISSIVEYEGIDTLVRAAFELELAIGAQRDVRPEGIPDGRGSVAPDGRAVEVVSRGLELVHPHLSDDARKVLAASLLRATRSLVATSVRLMVVGDGAELQNLRELALELGLESVLFTGRVPHESVLDYYGLIDLFVVPRKRAAVTELVTPLKPFEALSSGRPCVFSDVGALAEIARDSGCVELFRADDHHDLALTVAKLLGDPGRLAQMSVDGARWVRESRTWDMNAAAYLDVYRSLGLEPRDLAASSVEGHLGPDASSAIGRSRPEH